MGLGKTVSAQDSRDTLKLLKERLAEKDAQIQWLQDKRDRLRGLLECLSLALPSQQRFRWPWSK